ncbi:MAG: MBL fold metallo-hydrolase [Chloroflexota bacterium]
MAVTISFYGAARTVTGSQHLLTVNGFRILLDCGFFQGSRNQTFERNRNLPFDATAVDVMVLSHAHIDHSANIPNLVKSGFTGDIICTAATRDLCTLMLRDSAKIQDSDVEYLNRKRKRQDLPLLEPIYTMEEAVYSLNHFVGINYERPFRLAPGITVTLFDAGHLLGSAIVVIDITEESGELPQRLVFSGDLGRPDRPILNDPVFIDHTDTLIMESTYGNREHPENVAIDDELRKIILDTYKRGGKVIVPAFSVGRTQELVYRMNQMVEERNLPPDLRVFVDSPLAIDATGIYRMHPEAFDSTAAEMLISDSDHDLFGFNMMRYTRTVQESKELNFLRDPAVIISASGMAESGRILHHLKNNIEDPRNTIMIVGFQAPNTLGRRLVEGQSRVKIFGEDYDVKAQVVTMNGLSAHADRSELINWAGHFQQPPSHTFLVHGEPESAFALADGLQNQLDFEDVQVPELGQQFTL